MNQTVQPLSTGRWVGRVIVAVLVAEGVWGLIVSLTRDVIVPLLARQMGGVSQSPQNARDINVPGIFTAVVALCLAGLVAVILNAWVNRPVRGRMVAAAATPLRTSGAPQSIAPPKAPVAAAVPATATTPAAPAPVVQPASSPSPVTASKPLASAPPPATPAAKPAPTAPPAKPAKPKPPKEIQYNIVGEPISPMDEDE